MAPVPTYPEVPELASDSEHDVVRSFGQVLDAAALQAVRRDAVALVAQARRARPAHWPDLQAILSTFPISDPAGVNLLRLAEALPRTTDDRNQVALLADKLQAAVTGLPTRADAADRLPANPALGGQAASHRIGRWFDRAAHAALRLTGKALPSAVDAAAGGRRGSLAARAAAGVVRPAARGAVASLGRQFVFGEAVEDALALAERARRDGASDLRHSFDMLGEGARTWHDADRNLQRYAHALDAIARSATPGAGLSNDGMSIKISAIHPRYEIAQYPHERERLLERLAPLFEAAARADVNLTIDAEESERLPMHLDLFAALAQRPSLRHWAGLGLVVQAYQLRALPTIEAVLRIAGERRAQGGAAVAVRLVKGAYWDAEIKRSQELGLAGYPVFTDKGATDRSYLACAERLLAAGDRVFAQFATHNAVTIAALLEQARRHGAGPDRFELQRLHGMGEAVHQALPTIPQAGGEPAPPCRVYAPVGDQTQLLAYLIRRMLENGASTSFVRRLADPALTPEAVVDQELAALERDPGLDCAIPRPPQLYRERRNAIGLDLHDPRTLRRLTRAVHAQAPGPGPGPGPGAEDGGACGQALPERDGQGRTPGTDAEGRTPGAGAVATIRSPADRHRTVGRVPQADAAAVGSAVGRARAAFDPWQGQPVERRAQLLERWADALEADLDPLVALCVREAGKTMADAIADVREAVDFCRYYAVQARRLMGEPVELHGPTGEHNELRLGGRGVFACISPWNFPVAIFVGQTAAALVAGNTVVAKPAEQTPLAARHAAALAHRCGVPADVLQVLAGPGATVGAALVADARIAGVAFTGSNATAKSIQRALCDHPGIVPLIAETGGQNAMIVDSTALPEQVVDAVVHSAFRSAGQRCSALRVLAVQDEIADLTIEMIEGALHTLVVGDPADPATDVGPVIDEVARARLDAHLDAMRARGRRVVSRPLPAECARGSFVAPSIVELARIDELDREHFGPILHVVRFRIDELDALIDAINGLGFGLTLGVHTRIDARAERIRSRARVGNVYVNRNMIGAVVGVQPFGGEGLSGTGPKAGGPHYLLRFVTERTWTVNTAAAGGNLALLAA